MFRSIRPDIFICGAEAIQKMQRKGAFFIAEVPHFRRKLDTSKDHTPLKYCPTEIPSLANAHPWVYI